MPTKPLPLGSYRAVAPAASSRQLVNCYAQETPPERPNGQSVTLERAPGITDWNSGSGDSAAMRAKSEQRGAVVMAGVLYVCAGDSVYSVDSAGNPTALTGSGITGNGPVRMETNGTTFVILPGDGYGFSSTGTTVSPIADATFTDGGAADPCYVDGYLAFRRMGESFLFHTEADSLTFDGTFFTDVDGAPGPLVGMIANNRELIAVKAATSERYYDAANSEGSAFSRSPNGFYEQGCAAGRSLTQQDNAPFMLANDRTFRRLGGNWERVSHHGIEAAVQRMTTVDDCFAIPYRQEGHHFIAWTFPTEGRTFVKDLNTQEWHERESSVDTISLGRWRPSFIVEAYGKQIVGDSVSGRLGILDPDEHEEWGEPQTMEWTYGNLYAAGRNMTIRRMEIGVVPGQGTITGQGSDPQLTLYVSRDGGNTFSAQPSKSVGQQGDYTNRVQYFGLGMARNFVAKCQVSDPIRTIVVDTQVDAVGART